MLVLWIMTQQLCRRKWEDFFLKKRCSSIYFSYWSFKVTFVTKNELNKGK